jgi:hypothetical protein
VLRRFAKDESGIALPLAIMMIVLIGVMGAGLLVFVRSDLLAVVEVNRGQRAFEIAEAGVQVAKTQQLSDVVRQHYDRDITNDCANDQRRTTTEDWSPNTTVYNDPRNCDSGTTTRSSGGITRNFAGGKFNVTIECFDQNGDPSDICAGISENAPESIEARKRAFFKITSTGYYPADESGAKRRVEAIYHTNRLDVPTAYYTPNNIEFNGGVSISGVSFFAGGNITKTPSASLSVDRNTPAIYRDWDTTNLDNFTPTSNFNTVPRRKADGSPAEGAGFAARGTVQDFGTDPVVGPTRGYYDYDSNTTPRFVCKTSPSPPNPSNPPCSSATIDEPNSSGTISFPFNPNAEFDLEVLEQAARDQGNYYEGDITIDTNTTGSNEKYPQGSSDLTVFYVRANGATIDYKVNYNPRAKGLIVIENGNFEISNSSSGFEGVVIVTGNGTTTGDYTSIGNDTVEGFVVADGTMRIGGEVGPSAVYGDFSQRPGFFDMRLWSWRERYD